MSSMTEQTLQLAQALLELYPELTYTAEAGQVTIQLSELTLVVRPNETEQLNEWGEGPQYDQEPKLIDCPACDGTGEVDDDDVDIESSDYDPALVGKVSCPHCEGQGEVEHEPSLDDDAYERHHDK